jgi:hypothetical protein
VPPRHLASSRKLLRFNFSVLKPGYPSGFFSAFLDEYGQQGCAALGLAKREDELFRLQGSFCQAPLGQFTPGAYGSGSRLYGYGSRLCGRITEPLDLVARDCDFTALFVSDIRLAAKLGPETASNNAAAIATT